MKQSVFFKVMLFTLITSCSTVLDDSLNVSYEEIVKFKDNIATRAIECDSSDLGELVQWEPKEEIHQLKELYNKTRLMMPEMTSENTKIISPGTSNDAYFNSNIYAIRELPITIKARAISSGSSSGYCFMTCPGANKEVTLGKLSTAANSKFYLKIMPASSGIPYLIYSYVSNTPLCVGYYTNNPENKVLMSASNDSGSLYSASWDLLPSSSHKGYFAIQSESYLGQSDPDDMWSVFNYVLEAKAKNKIGYSQRDENKEQQEFFISPVDSFKLKSLEYDIANAKFTSSTMISKITSLTNTLEIERLANINISLTANETSYFNEAKGNLSLNISVPSNLKFPRPVVVANQIVLLNNTPSDAIYDDTTQKISKTVNYSTSILMKPRSLLKLTTKFNTFSLIVPYVATATYKAAENDMREVRVQGTWRGYIIADPEYYLPVNEPRFFDLDTGEEKNYLFEYNKERNLYTVK